jgi:transcriptional regulator NrdR family protein
MAVVFIKDKAGKMVHCPECDSTDIRYSESHHILDMWMILRKRHSVRCRACRARFYAATDEAKNVMWVK